MSSESQKKKKIKEMNWLTRFYSIEFEYKLYYNPRLNSIVTYHSSNFWSPLWN
jgi:hypothetical protein